MSSQYFCGRMLSQKLFLTETNRCYYLFVLLIDKGQITKPKYLYLPLMCGQGYCLAETCDGATVRAWDGSLKIIWSDLLYVLWQRLTRWLVVAYSAYSENRRGCWLLCQRGSSRPRIFSHSASDCGLWCSDGMEHGGAASEHRIMLRFALSSFCYVWPFNARAIAWLSDDRLLCTY